MTNLNKLAEKKWKFWKKTALYEAVMFTFKASSIDNFPKKVSTPPRPSCGWLLNPLFLPQKMVMPHKTTQHQRSQMVKAYLTENKSVRDIAAENNLSLSIVRYRLHKIDKSQRFSCLWREVQWGVLCFQTANGSVAAKRNTNQNLSVMFGFDYNVHK